MARPAKYKPVYTMLIEQGQSYSVADFPTIPGITIDTIEVTEATFLPGAKMGVDGKLVKEDEKTVYAMTNVRGIKFRIEVPNTTASARPNIATLFQLGDEIVFDSTYKYVCTEGYGSITLGVAE